MKHRLVLLAVVALALAAPSLAAAAGAGRAFDPASFQGSPATIVLSIKSDTQHGKRDVKGVWHDAYLPAACSVAAGQKVTFTVTNFDPAPHTFTAPGLKLNVVIAAAKGATPATTSFSFTAPAKKGGYDWFCAAGCDPWAMTHYGFMRGRVTVA